MILTGGTCKAFEEYKQTDVICTDLSKVLDKRDLLMFKLKCLGSADNMVS